MASPRPKIPPYLFLLLVAFALLGLISFHTLRDRRVWNELLEAKDSDIIRLEKEVHREKKWAANELHDLLRKAELQRDKLIGVIEDLRGQLIVLKNINATIEGDKKRLESSLQDGENEVSDLKEKLDLFQKKEQELENEISQKDAKIDELKAQLTKAQALISAEEHVLAAEENAVNQSSYKVGRSQGIYEGEERTEQASMHSETEGHLTEEQGGDTEVDTEDTRQERATDNMKENQDELEGNVTDETSSKEDVNEDSEAEKILEETEGGGDRQGDRGDTRDLLEGAPGDLKENEDALNNNVRDETLSDDDVDEDGKAEK